MRLLPYVDLRWITVRHPEDVPLARSQRYGISGSVGIFALNLIIGGLIGGLAFFIGLLLGVIHTIREII